MPNFLLFTSFITSFLSSFLTSTTQSIDTTVVDSLVDIVTKLLELFTIFPLNIFLTASFVGIAIGVIRKLKRS